ncbi:MAG: methyltransferase domain-containing protein [Chloroflexi bacterium]|nr:methyltransferase domain-containing protein [Chloroflexota bacterium]
MVERETMNVTPDSDERGRTEVFRRGPAQWLVDNIELLPKGRALDVAMGKGRNAIFLAGSGFDVEGVDISNEAVAASLESARNAGVVIKAQVADLEGNEYRIAAGAYDLIICFDYLQRSLLPDIKAGLKPGGMVVYETYIVGQDQFGRPRNPEHLLKHNELLNMFRDFRCLRYREGLVEEDKVKASIVAQNVACV